jgi:hypothetical protein
VPFAAAAAGLALMPSSRSAIFNHRSQEGLRDREAADDVRDRLVALRGDGDHVAAELGRNGLGTR